MLCNTVVQGTKQEIEAIIKLAEEELGGECEEIIEYKNLTVAHLLFYNELEEIIEEKFTSVKWMGFVEDFDEGAVFLASSGKGNDIEDMEFLFYDDFHNDDRIASQHFPDEKTFSSEVFWCSAGEYEDVYYKCPCYNWWMADIQKGFCNLPLYLTPDKRILIKYKSDLIAELLEQYHYTTDFDINYLNEICIDENILADKNFAFDYYGISTPTEFCATLFSCLKTIGTFDDGLEEKFSNLISEISESLAEAKCKAVFIDHDYNSEEDDTRFKVNEFTLEKIYSLRTYGSFEI